MSEKRNRLNERPAASRGEPRIDFLKITLRHKSLVALGIVIAIVLGAFYYAQETPIYQSSAEILIVNKRPESVVGGSVSYFSDYMSMHQALIVSPVIVNRSMQRPEVQALKTQNIRYGLKVGAGSMGQNANNILTLSFQGEIPEECPIVVNAVLESYQAFLEETYKSMSDATVQLMEESCKTLLADLREQEKAYRTFRQDAPLIISAENGVSPAMARLNTIQSQQAELFLKRIELESQMASIQKAKDAGRDEEYLKELVSNLALGADSASSQVSETQRLLGYLLPLMYEEKGLANSNFGYNHPSSVSIRDRIKQTQDFFENPDRYVAKKKEDIVQSYVEYLNQELDRIATSIKIFDSLYDAEHAAAKEFTNFEIADTEFQRNMARTQQLYDGYVTQLQEANLSKDYGGFKADVIAPPGFGIRVKPDAMRVFPASLMLGIFLGVFLAFLAEMTDSSFHSSEEIGTAVGLPLVGQIPQFAPRTIAASARDASFDSLDKSLYTHFWPRSVETEAYRGLRTGMYFSNRDNARKVIQVTSSCPSEGKSTVASNLGVCIAQSGKRVLLIDADLRLPRLHKIFGVESESGLSTVIALGEELTEAIQETAIENLSILPAGQIPPDPAELLTSPVFGELLSVVREKYDYVIVDTGPLLAISDPRIVSSQVDGLLLTVWLKKTKRKQLEQARNILASVDAPILGVVVNAASGAESRGYGYGYGQYGSYYQNHESKAAVKSRLQNGSAKPAAKPNGHPKKVAASRRT